MSSTNKAEPALLAGTLPDRVSIRLWFAFYALLLVATGVPLVILISHQPWAWSQWIENTGEVFRQTSPGIKLLGFGIYLSLCCTFLPLPTGWIVAGVATREAAVAGGFSSNALVVAFATTAAVAAIGALGSTVGNLNDYHLFTWMLRHHRLAKVRHTKTYHAAVRWFRRSPFFILVIFNIIPIPVDVIRMLATTYRYPRLPFAGANFIGRFVRYGVIAFVTYWWNLGWIAVVSLLGLAVVLGAYRTLPIAIKKAMVRVTNRSASKVSEQQVSMRE